jgi:hypothetical protein
VNVRTNVSSPAPSGPEELEAVRRRSEGHFERLEGSSAILEGFTERLLGRSTRTPDAELSVVERDRQASTLVLERLLEREPSVLIEAALIRSATARHALSAAAAERLAGLHLPLAEDFARQVEDACRSLEFEFDRPVHDVSSMMVGVFPYLVGLVLVMWELGRLLDGSWHSFPWSELKALAVAGAWYLRSRWVRSRRAEKRVRLTVFGIHANEVFVPFEDIAVGWLALGGAVMLETKTRLRMKLETNHAVELQQALMHHGVEFVARRR